MIRKFAEITVGVLMGLFIVAVLNNIKQVPIPTCVTTPITASKSNYKPGSFESEAKRTL